MTLNFAKSSGGPVRPEAADDVETWSRYRQRLLSLR